MTDIVVGWEPSDIQVEMAQYDIHVDLPSYSTDVTVEVTGPMGPAGQPGTDGQDGADGADGQDGEQGPPGASGSTILSGTATPTGAVGNDGDYYLDTDAAILYGPKIASGTPEAGVSVHTSQVPTSEVAGPNEFGIRITCTVAGNITALRYYRVAASQTSRTMRLWNNATSALLGSVNTSGESGTGWKTATLSAPVAVAAGQQIVASYTNTAAQTAMNTGGSAMPISNGSLTATTGVQGAGGGFPGGALGYDFFTDVVFEASPNLWPIALQGVVKGTTPPTDLNAVWIDTN